MMGLGKRNAIRLLAGVIVLQLFAATAVLAQAWHTRATGEEILLRSVPVDPRSLFRGNYARVRYEISNVTVELTQDELTPAVEKTGLNSSQKIYVVVAPDKDGVHRFQSASLTKPVVNGDERVISGRTESNCTVLVTPDSRADCRVRYGIEAWFAPKTDALELERQFAKGALARVRVTNSGRAALMGIVESSAENQ